MTQQKSTINVRLPKDEDWASFYQLVRKHHARTVFADIPFSEKKYAAIEHQARNPAPHQCLIVAEAKGKVVGLAWITAGEYALGDGGVMTTTHLLAVDAEECGPFLSAKVFKRLLRGIVIWSQSRNARQVLVHVSTGTAIKQTDRLLRSSGAICIGGSYLLEVEPT